MGVMARNAIQRRWHGHAGDSQAPVAMPAAAGENRPDKNASAIAMPWQLLDAQAAARGVSRRLSKRNSAIACLVRFGGSEVLNVLFGMMPKSMGPASLRSYIIAEDDDDAEVSGVIGIAILSATVTK